MDEPTSTANTPLPAGPAGLEPGAEPAPSQDTSFLSRLERLWAAWYVIIPIVFALGMAAGYYLWGRAAAPAAAASAAVEIPESVTRYDIPTDGDPSIGPEDAKITIVEFSDYQCPYCKRWHDQVFGQLMKEYADEVRFVYRDFPLTSIHPQAFPAALAANCAGEQNAYWDYHEALFSQKYELGQDAYEKYAAELGLDTTSFVQCLEDGRYSDEVNGDMTFAADLGITSTPTFFINGIPMVGAQPYDIFKQVIDLELAGKIPQN